MKNNRIVAALLCASMGFASAAFAQQGPDDNHGNHGAPGHDPHAMHGAPEHGPEHGPAMNGHDAPRPPEHANAGPRHPDWRKGDRLDQDYRNRQYVVDDWHGYGLRQPPRGYQWVGVGGDFLLVAVASGVIAQVVLSQ